MKVEINNCKIANTLPISRLFTQGEKNVDRIEVVIPFTTYDGNDLTKFVYRMHAVNLDHDIVIGDQNLPKTINESSIILTWIIGGGYTSNPGKVSFEIIGSNSSGSDIIKFIGAPIYVRPSARMYTGQVDFTQSIIDQLLSQFGVFVQNAKDEADRAKVEANRSANEVDNAKKEVRNAAAEVEKAIQIKESSEVLFDVESYRVGFKHRNEPEYTYTNDLRGASGTNGVITSLSPGLFGLSIEDGHLILTHNDNEPAPNMYINSEGHLIYVITDDGETPHILDLGYVIGPRGPQGEPGKPFKIKKTYSTISAMFGDYSNSDVEIGDFVIIASSVDDEDNAKLYVKTNETFVLITDLSGAQGIQGPEGSAATVSIGSVTSGDTPSITNSGTSTNAVFNFVLQRGEQGKIGQTGANGFSPTVEINQTDNGYDVTITDVNGTHTATLLNGSVGPVGPAGPTGKNGITPTFQINAEGHLIATFETD